MKKIIITKNGPYKVIGNIPLNEIVITQTAEGNQFIHHRKFETEKEYYLCRCGNSKNAPFCDRSHIKAKFDGSLVASKDSFIDQAITYEGEELLLYDNESLCAFSRFCHNNKTDVWTATENDQLDDAKKLSMLCPSGRMVLEEIESDKIFEYDFEDEISIIQDPTKECSGPIWVKGNIQIEDEDGYVYEKRNRVALCRCGNSENKPFCNAMHVSIQFNDGLLNKK